jgi:hypothetical protein
LDVLPSVARIRIDPSSAAATVLSDVVVDGGERRF